MSLLTIFWIIAPFLGAWLARINGGSPPDLPFSLETWLISSPFFILAYQMSGSITLALLSFAFAYLGQRLGHGEYFDLGTSTNKEDPEKIDFIVKWFFGEDKTDEGNPSLVRDLFGQSVTGFVCSIGIAITALLCSNPIVAILCVIGCSLKGLMYYIPYKVLQKTDKFIFRPHLEWFTQWGELLTGFTRILFLSISALFFL